ncbi:hypothetical protein M0D70_02285 [Acinetobacter portensis]|uniref:Isopropylmalate isomerase n=2 Tax=Acinetobacter TaxID=469 RepID=A0AB35UP03_9GAMM|nr:MULTISPECIES: hypothetical protein [Acinetobacter]MCK7608192.1 hypothetical protein [Acinetobacter portensis]MCK7639011.1 hypothetical protein [Acinetobacter portensis]MDY6459295.1 hypothetical protein [Acinetobacter faecalis]MDY6485639.1 hypothetical protein [Acinetobacter faecalis]MDY6488511.1 hypothetical protein [Acinetobacter faecalis]
MANKKNSKNVAPLVIAGLTAGLLVSAYRFVFAKNKPKAKHDTTPKDSE